MDSSSASFSSAQVEFQEIPSEICNNKDINCYFTVSGDYTPHRLDKIHLCPVDYTSDFQELNTWEFVTCRKTDNEIYPYEGEVTFSCEKYGFLVLDNANASGYTLKYVNKDGHVFGETNMFSILLEETESAMLGMSYVFLPDELNSPTPVESDSAATEQFIEPKPQSPIPESLPSLNLNEPTPSLFPLNLAHEDANRQIRTQQQLEFLEGTVKEMKEQRQDLEEKYENKMSECEKLAELTDELLENKGEEKRYEEQHKKGLEILGHGFAQLFQTLLPDERMEIVPETFVQSLLAGTEDMRHLNEQMDGLIEAAETQRAEKESLVLENGKLKDECKNLQAVVQDYKNQLILASQEQAQISDKMTQLQKDQDILKTYEAPPKKTSSPDKSSCKPEREILHAPKTRPRHLPVNNGHYETESIIMTEPAKGKSDRTFAALNFLKSCSINEEENVFCPVCLKFFEKCETSVNRTKHVNRCLEKSKDTHV